MTDFFTGLGIFFDTYVAVLQVYQGIYKELTDS